MAPLPEEGYPLVGLFGQFVTWAQQGLSTADIWGNLRYMEDQGTIDLQGISGSMVSTVRGAAGAYLRNQSGISNLAPEHGLNNVEIPTALWARGANEQALAPMFQVRVLQTVLDTAGNESQQWRTVVMTDLPATAGDLYSALDTEGEAMAANYGVTYAGSSSAVILRV